ncbi:MAG: hypothetical protein AAGI15_01900 [Pseudomonadota bacterium]
MTLQTRRKRYPRPELQAPRIWIACTVVLTVLFFSLSATDDARTQAQQAYGRLSAETVAGLSAAALLTQDRIELGLICQRLTAQPGIAQVRIIGMDGAILATAGERGSGAIFEAPVTTRSAAIGTVELTLDPASLPGRRLWPWLLALAVAAALPWLLQLGLAALTRLRERAPRAVGAPPAATPKTAPDRGEVLVVANLLNQFALAPAVRQALLTETLATVADHAAHYGARVERLASSGLLLRLAVGEQGPPERVYEGVCAALVMARYLASREDDGIFRLGLHYRGAGVAPDAAIADTALLAATAAEGQIMLSAEARSELQAEEQTLAEPATHPLGEDLTTTGATGYRLEHLPAADDARLDAQLAALPEQSPG